MTQEHQPVTKGDFEMLSLHINEYERKVGVFKNVTIGHFDKTVAALRRDLLRAGSGEIANLRATLREHDERIRRLEQHLGLIV